MMRIRNYAVLLSTVLIMMVMAGCRSKKIAEASQPEQWTTFSAPLKVKLESPKKVNISGRCTMERGKSILLSVRMLGMEIGNAYVTPDSVYVLDKIHKYLLAESLDEVLNGNYVEFTALQELLTGNGDAAPWIADAIDYKAVTDEQTGSLTVSAAVDLSSFVAGSLVWDMKSAKLNDPDLTPWKRPEGYTRVKASAVANMLKQL
ncbi:MAG: DUF4292 domain-containing protein [Muribaculaceae bacterium]|nr:DUF4292 domain-containing protein [Muribaculaceae bacterium]